MKTKTNWRWWICSLLFAATTIKYMDSQILPMTYEDFIKPRFHWTDSDYGTVTSLFCMFYALACLFAGKFIDWIGTKKGYLVMIGLWSVGTCLYSLGGWVTTRMVAGIDNPAALPSLESVSSMALSISSHSVYFFLVCGCILAFGQAGNFPVAIKVTAEYFPKKDRALATSVFNSGASVAAMLSPLFIPALAMHLGWETTFVVMGCVGFVWMLAWAFMYEKPEESRQVSEEEYAYIQQDGLGGSKQKRISIFGALKFRQTWSFILAKFLTDGIWWLFVFWAPSYFTNQFDAHVTSGLGQSLIFTIYLIVIAVSVLVSFVPRVLMDGFGLKSYGSRMISMALCAVLAIASIFIQPLGLKFNNPWIPAVLIGIAGAAHQAWSANLFSTIGDLFPKSAVATVTGIGAMAGGIGAMVVQKAAGWLFDFSEKSGEAFTFLGYDGKPAGYFAMFLFCGLAYLLAWALMVLLVPRHQPVRL